MREEGFSCEREQDDETEEWTCYCFIKMFLNYDEIINIQKRLDELSKPYNGYSDGGAVMIG
ncbi:ribonuclease E inhibitor RraB [Metabacillus fastidiosus]|uniref:Ribonuclease E inhibitor RraB n=1 Tax=Metabacillus fastidiosus TaxID=1458 RepID=A0ABU6NZ46_9BACI|nr:ribonuclease E inhibitor RraB [Metabacillus fastidiosus]MED4402394.1 ribonuclease E inhibitor RraB [Metabacillus fastidiosus]MED4462266.1 ribonuclease E inhibitor RraB [Metabacillus fastidiosus]